MSQLQTQGRAGRAGCGVAAVPVADAVQVEQVGAGFQLSWKIKVPRFKSVPIIQMVKKSESPLVEGLFPWFSKSQGGR